MDTSETPKKSILLEIYETQQRQQLQLDNIAMKIKDNNDLIIKLMSLIDLKYTIEKQQTEQVTSTPKKIIRTVRPDKCNVRP